MFNDPLKNGTQTGFIAAGTSVPIMKAITYGMNAFCADGISTTTIISEMVESGNFTNGTTLKIQTLNWGQGPAALNSSGFRSWAYSDQGNIWDEFFSLNNESASFFPTGSLPDLGVRDTSYLVIPKDGSLVNQFSQQLHGLLISCDSGFTESITDQPIFLLFTSTTGSQWGLNAIYTANLNYDGFGLSADHCTMTYDSATRTVMALGEIETGFDGNTTRRLGSVTLSIPAVINSSGVELYSIDRIVPIKNGDGTDIVWAADPSPQTFFDSPNDNLVIFGSDDDRQLVALDFSPELTEGYVQQDLGDLERWKPVRSKLSV